MAITNFIPEIWAAQLQTSLKKNLVFGGVCNRNYEGDIANAGDTVRIVSISRPTVADYVKNSTTISPETLTDAERSLTVDQCKYFAFELDDVDARQAKDGGALLSEAASEAAYALADTLDSYVAGLYGDAATANKITTTAITDAAKAVKGIVDLKVVLDKANVPNAGRYVIVPPWYLGLLLQSDLFVRLDASGTTEALRNGQVGRAFGFDVLVSNNAVLATGDDYIVQAGVPAAITLAEQINKVEAFRPESAFSDAVKGLHLYGAKVVRPTALATLTASIT